MLADGIIEPSRSQYSSPIVIVEKEDKIPHFCVDYRKLNQVTTDVIQPIPIIHEALKNLGQATIFTMLDLKSGYWQIPMDPSSRKYTALLLMMGTATNPGSCHSDLTTLPACSRG